MSQELDDFKSFIVTLGDVAEKGQLEKAAEGISKIADSINKIDIDKTVAFGDLFKASNDLGENRSAYKALARAVEDIRDMMSESGGDGPNLLEKITGTGAAAKSSGGSSGGSNKLDKTLRSLNSAINSLPGKMQTAIATADITVSLPD